MNGAVVDWVPANIDTASGGSPDFVSVALQTVLERKREQFVVDALSQIVTAIAAGVFMMLVEPVARHDPNP